jgi:hypothetical protein
MVLVGIGALLGLVGAIFGIIILINAFKTDTTQGILCLCVPIYILYWAFAKFTHPKKGMILGLWLGCGVIAGILYSVGAGMMVSDAAGAFQQQMQMQGMPTYPPQ